MIATLSQLKSAMANEGVTLCYVKSLSPNDNSKNQIYLGSSFEVLNMLPIKSIEVDSSDLAGSKYERTKAPIDFHWLLDGSTEPADNAQLILYPKYPEVRLSGLLLGTSGVYGEVVSSRDEGRLLFLGVTESRGIVAFASAPTSAISNEFQALSGLHESGVFKVWPIVSREANTKNELLRSLRTIYDGGFHSGRILQTDGSLRPYKARNGGGYTLESLLGISPNSDAAPDYLGWEVKQFGTSGPPNFRPKSPITLMTPEPTSGIYKEKGAKAFIREFGYPDKSGIQNRLNFGGVYRIGQGANPNTGLRLEITGYDPASPKVFSLHGSFSLVTAEGAEAATWTFSEMLQHWNKKHAQAAYVSSTSKVVDGFPNYQFGPNIHLGEGTEFPLLLLALANSSVYLDPALKLVTSNGGEELKRRNQFRIKLKDLGALYYSHSVVDLRELSF